MLENYKSSENFAKIAAPMVRYSTLPFRCLVRENGCDITYTPMIMADSFVASKKARDNEFAELLSSTIGSCDATDPDNCNNNNITERKSERDEKLQVAACDQPVIVQFASKSANEFSEAALLVHNGANGVDLNCGCPQRWARQMGLGSSLIDQPQLIEDIVKTARQRIPRECKQSQSKSANGEFSVSAKIRLHPHDFICEDEKESGGVRSMRHSVELISRLDRVGVDWISVHARTPAQRGPATPADWRAIAELICAVPHSARSKIVLNGDVTDLEGARRAHAMTGCAGVMAANGLILNPAMFLEPHQQVSSWRLARRFVELSVQFGASFQQMHQHLIPIFHLEQQHQQHRPEESDSMLSDRVSLNKDNRFFHTRHDRQQIHALSSSAALINFIDQQLVVESDFSIQFK